jgi:hypothetical protein
MDIQKEIEADFKKFIKKNPLSSNYLDAFRYGFWVGWCKGAMSEKNIIKQMEAVI